MARGGEQAAAAHTGSGEAKAPPGPFRTTASSLCVRCGWDACARTRRYRRDGCGGVCGCASAAVRRRATTSGNGARGQRPTNRPATRTARGAVAAVAVAITTLSLPPPPPQHRRVYGAVRPSADEQRPSPPRRDAPYRLTSRQRREPAAVACIIYANYCSHRRHSLRHRADLGALQNILLPSFAP